MRILLGAVVLAALVWGGLWFAGAATVERSIAGWVADQTARGVDVQYDTLETMGFPNRLDTLATGLRLSDPRSGASVGAELFQVFALVYRPHHVIAKGQGLEAAGPGSLVSGTAAELESSVVFRASTDLPLDRMTAIFHDLSLVAGGLALLDSDETRFAMRQAVGRADAYDVALVGEGVRPGDAARAMLAGGSDLPEMLETLRIDMTVGLDAPLDRHLADAPPPRMTDITFGNSQIAWGTMEIALDGRVEIDPSGQPEGRIDLRLEGWEQLAALAGSGSETPQALQQTLKLLAQISDDPNVIDVPLSFQKGFMSLGPLPLGPAPRYRQ